jgi:hypothetical protein
MPGDVILNFPHIPGEKLSVLNKGFKQDQSCAAAAASQRRASASRWPHAVRANRGLGEQDVKSNDGRPENVAKRASKTTGGETAVRRYCIRPDALEQSSNQTGFRPQACQSG